MDTFQEEIENKVRVTIAADREDVARQCSEAHGRMDYQFRTQDESLEKLRIGQLELREFNAAAESKRTQQTVADISAAVDALDHRVIDREHQKLDEMHRQLVEEVQLMIGNELKALESAKDKEQRKLRQHQHVVGRKLAELDQMMQLIGRQLIQNTSQLQVVRNEQLAHDFHLDLQDEDTAYEDNEPLHTAELLTRRSQHQELQEQLDQKLRDYSQVLDPNQHQTITDDHLRQPKK
ncbi:hypothetical protein PHMEG_00012224 [Phytophthora megakarya]|uniref:Uncharacterized protein n=1 Tax=Phytophthora megakarya TaxID=4795 RepID=A0A225W9Q2_9STRA|nr:hypothetical protein PHMEG_00012224 [Phytophthora megakarya]